MCGLCIAAFTVEGTKQKAMDVVWPSMFHLLALRTRAWKKQECDFGHFETARFECDKLQEQ